MCWTRNRSSNRDSYRCEKVQPFRHRHRPCAVSERVEHHNLIACAMGSYDTTDEDNSLCIDGAFDLDFAIFGEPIPLQRHRFARGVMYNPSAREQREFSSMSMKHLPQTPLEGPLEATLLFYFSRPKHHYGSGRNAGTVKESAPI